MSVQVAASLCLAVFPLGLALPLGTPGPYGASAGPTTPAWSTASGTSAALGPKSRDAFGLDCRVRHLGFEHAGFRAMLR